ncbi:MAG TPA: type I-C CRISPR-associated protein Cas8c/Csd1 [Blastocatellia bacterium]|nr:type I-C CRISPR-associated protein Cas8c/Csd1 [Blastocatellia bacterium]
MLLKALYDLAHSRKLLDDLAFTKKAIRWVISLDAEGNLLGQGPVQLGDKKGGIKKDCPRILADTNSGKVADFLTEGVDGMFGLSPDPKKPKDAKKLAAKHEHFWTQISDCFQATGHPALDSILKYREKLSGQPPSFVKLIDDKWHIVSASGDEAPLGNDEFAFEVTDEFVVENEQIKAYWKTAFAKMQGGDDGETGEIVKEICLVTGAEGIIARTHSPKIKNVPNTLNNQGKLVSFEKSSPSFSSFGRVQSYNAPISEEAATAYCIALNWLLSQRNHSIRIKNAPTIFCFWARDSEEATDIFAELFEQPKPDTVHRFLTAPLRGAEHHGIKPDEFYSVTLAGNAGRIVVRHWMQCPLDAATENLKQWFRDLEIAPFGDPAAAAKARKKTDGEGREAPQPLGLYMLAMTTVRESKDLQPELLTQLYRAALEGHAPSVMLLKPLLNRFAKELASDGPNLALRRLSRFALLRLILNRNRKEGEPMIEPQVFETSDPAYNCGRLLAIFDDLQMRAHEYQLEGAGVVERYYGSASSAPNSAFGILWRLHQHHLKKVSRQGDRGKAAAEAIKRKIAEIAALFPQPKPNFPPEFPRAFSLVEQGRFALGFYQQKAADDAARKKAKSTDERAEGNTLL